VTPIGEVFKLEARDIGCHRRILDVLGARPDDDDFAAVASARSGRGRNKVDGDRLPERDDHGLRAPGRLNLVGARAEADDEVVAVSIDFRGVALTGVGIGEGHDRSRSSAIDATFDRRGRLRLSRAGQRDRQCDR
jgi:hypothetical protein